MLMSTIEAFFVNFGAQQPAICIQICFAFTSYTTKCGVGKIYLFIYFFGKKYCKNNKIEILLQLK